MGGKFFDDEIGDFGLHVVPVALAVLGDSDDVFKEVNLCDVFDAKEGLGEWVSHTVLK